MMFDQRTSVSTEDRKSLSVKLSDGRTLSYSTYGPPGGIPFLMNHGTPGSRISSEENIYHELGLQMIYPERPGYGNSSPNKAGTFKSWAEDVAELLNHLGIQQVHIGGVSGGGAFTLGCIAHQPGRFKSATLISTAAPPQTPNHKKGMALGNILGYWLIRFAPFLARVASNNFANGFKANPDRAWNNLSRQLSESDKAVLESAKGNEMYEIFKEHILEAFKHGTDGHCMDMKILAGTWNIPFHQIQSPIYIWHGDEDTLAPIAGAKALASWLPSAHLFTKQGKGHLLAEEDEILKEIYTLVLNTNTQSSNTPSIT